MHRYCDKAAICRLMGHFDVGIAAPRRALVLDPLAPAKPFCARSDAVFRSPI